MLMKLFRGVLASSSRCCSQRLSDFRCKVITAFNFTTNIFATSRQKTAFYWYKSMLLPHTEPFFAFFTCNEPKKKRLTPTPVFHLFWRYFSKSPPSFPYERSSLPTNVDKNSENTQRFQKHQCLKSEYCLAVCENHCTFVPKWLTEDYYIAFR